MNELPSTAFGVIRLLPETKQEISNFSNQLIKAVKNGEINPLHLKAMLKSIEIMAKNVTEAIDENVLREADKYGEKTFNAYGFEIQKSENGIKYDYLSCGDPEYNELYSIVEEGKKKIEQRALFLKSLKKPEHIIQEDTGEVVTIKPPIRTGKEGLKFTLK